MKQLLPVVPLLVFFFAQQTGLAQCDPQMYTNQALQALPSGYNLVKTFRIDGKKGERKRMEHSLILNSNTNYVVRVASADGAAKGIEVDLYDARHQLITSTYANKTFLKGFTYKCQLTGRYFLVFRFRDSESYCGAASLGFKQGSQP